MSKKIIKEEIVRLLEAIVDQTQTIDQYKGVIPQIELDLIQDNIRQLYQYYAYLNTANKQSDSVVSPPEEKGEEMPPKAHAPREQPQPPVKTEEKKNRNPLKPTPEAKPAPEEKEFFAAPEKEKTQPTPEEEKSQPVPEERNPSPPIPEIKRPSAGEKQRPPEGKPEKPDLFTSKSGTLADKLQRGVHSSLYDRLGQSKKRSTLSERLKGDPVADIKTAIGINEKFLFINELFQGNVHDYNDAIKELNNAESLEKALELFIKLQEKHGWKKESPAALQLLNFVERRQR